ncbi:MAG: hypothetical protein C0499_00790 [Zymomonas sp.]|nr:hypothetical protein [Zymomonas sp.]MBA4044352.1 hypothetical protein [Erythrobacter sp.]
MHLAVAAKLIRLPIKRESEPKTAEQRPTAARFIHSTISSGSIALLRQAGLDQYSIETMRSKWLPFVAMTQPV